MIAVKLLSPALYCLLSIPVLAEPTLEWRYETGGKIYAPPAVADLDGDGAMEIVVAASRDKRVLCLDGKGELLWEFRIEDGHLDGIQAAPAIGDLNGDGYLEVVVVSKAGMLVCLDHRGALVWRSYIGDQVDYSGPLLADVNGDQRLEIVFGSESGTVYCYDDTGARLWGYQGQGAVRGVPAVAPQSHAASLLIYATFSDGGSVCLNGEGEVVWQHAEPGPRKERRSGPAVGDVDGDGRLEVCLATEDCVVIVRDAETGEERWRWKAQFDVDQTHSFALAAFDRAEGLDIVFGDGQGLSRPGNLYRVRDGQPLWTTDVGGGIVQGPAIGDVDGDGELEILACSRSSRLVCLSADGAIEWDFPTEAGSLTTPTLADVDGDGEVEILFASKDRSVYCVSVGGRLNPALLPWPRLGQNNLLTNFAGALPAPANQAPNVVMADAAFSMDAFGDALRMGKNSATLTVRNPAARTSRLELSAVMIPPAGPEVRQIFVAEYAPGEERVWTMPYEILLPGEYVFQAQLFNVGADAVLANESVTHRQKSFTVEKAEEKRLLTRIAQLRRANAAASYAVSAGHALEALETPAMTFDSSDDATEARDHIAAVHDRLTKLDRIAEKLEAAVSLEASDATFAVVPVSTMRKVYRDEVFHHEGSREAAIALARNEYEGVQLVVVPLWRDVANLRVSATALTLQGGANTIPVDDIEVNPVGYVTVGPPEYNFPVYKVGGDHPDVLLPNEPVSIPASQDAQPYFVTVRTQRDTASGLYEGHIRFEADGSPAVEIPLRVKVWNFALPDHPHLKTSFWFSEAYLQRFYGYSDGVPEAVRNRYLDFHLEHRLGPLKDFSESNLDALRYAMAGGQNALFYPLPAYVAPEDRPEFLAQLEQTRARVQELGWDDEMLFYTRDEVAVMGRHEIPRVVEFAQWLGEAFPHWPRLQTSAPEEQLIGMADIWCPTTDEFDSNILADRMARGERLWFYAVWGRPGILIEFPGTDTRLMFWQCWKYGAEGFLYWGTNHWDLSTQGEERWPDVPWIPWNRQPGHNGDGYLIYPGPEGTPLASIRLDLVRDGIEDYEYLHRLRELLEAQADELDAEVALRIQVELALDPAVFADHASFTEDPSVLHSARSRIGGLVELLEQRASGVN